MPFGGSMDVRERILKEFGGLIAETQQIIANCGHDRRLNDWRIWPAEDDFLRIRTRGNNLVRRACGEDSPHFQEMQRMADGAPSETNRLPQYLGILQAAEADFAGDLLLNLK